jgi:hypothetical protein
LTPATIDHLAELREVDDGIACRLFQFPKLQGIRFKEEPARSMLRIKSLYKMQPSAAIILHQLNKIPADRWRRGYPLFGCMHA